VSGGIVVREGSLADVPVIARHRTEMFRDMGDLRLEDEEPMRVRVEGFLRDAFAAGTYRAWLAAPASRPSETIAGAGVFIRPMMPRPRGDGGGVTTGDEALVMNVFTEREHRGRGAARLLMQCVIDWARGAGVDSLVLQASAAGRPLYEQLGFVPTREMRFDRLHRSR
jgi:GNAT superfamily N-acetyltransferase